MKTKFGLLTLCLVALLIHACQTPEERLGQENKADSLSNNPPVNTDVDMNSADTTAAIADTATAGSKTPGDTVAMKKKGTKGKVAIGVNETNNKEKMEMDKEGIYARAEVMPSYPGGQAELEKFVEENLQYPQTAIDNEVEGRVVLTFDVDESGKIYRPMIASQKIGYGLEEEALRVVKAMPQWNPGKMKGKNVKTKFTLPIIYQLQ